MANTLNLLQTQCPGLSKSVLPAPVPCALTSRVFEHPSNSVSRVKEFALPFIFEMSCISERLEDVATTVNSLEIHEMVYSKVS